jgi:hypothetical protein
MVACYLDMKEHAIATKRRSTALSRQATLSAGRRHFTS